MKILLLALIAASHVHAASSIDTVLPSTMRPAFTSSVLTTNGLQDAELQAIDEASNDEIAQLDECMQDAGTNEVGDTACVNDIFGDVHN